MKPISEALSDFVTLCKTGDAQYGILPHNDPSMLDRWSIALETQVKVHGGIPVEGLRSTYSDPQNPEHRWWDIRIPKNAKTEPEFEDRMLPWPPVLHTQALGWTGWDWKNRVSKFVGFDFDSISGHAIGVGVSDEKLAEIRQVACSLPWVETRRSTGGAGLHLYVHIDDIPTANHTEHAALGRCILGMMSSETGFDFAAQIDVCGGNMWFWHLKSTPQNQGLSLINPHKCVLGEIDLPTNWRDHIDVVRRKRSKVQVQGAGNGFEKLASAQQAAELDEQHKQILEDLRNLPYTCEWVPDHNCCRIHTCALRDLHAAGSIRGLFQTNSGGTDPSTANGFMFPIPNGGWNVYRFSQGIAEAPTWHQDGSNWTNCQFNVDADLRTAAKAFGGKLDGEKNGYVFTSAKDAAEAVKALGGSLNLPTEMENQEAFVKVGKTGHVTVEMAKKDGDNGDMSDWIAKKSKWLFTTNISPKTEIAISNNEIDNLVRNVMTPQHQEAGWLARGADGHWKWKAKDTIKQMMMDNGYKKVELDYVFGRAANNDWTLVNLPFQPEYPGQRRINWGAPQYAFPPSESDEPRHPTWDKILTHCFQDLDAVLAENEWAKHNNILTGRDYGLLWIACLLRDPYQPLPYLFLFGDQNCGKSILHESISMLMTSGCVAADKAFKSNNDFNGELANAILAYIEEVDLSNNPAAYNRLKSWVTSIMISIRKMRMDAYDQLNTLHFIQCANKRENCPIFPGDTRIVMLFVPDLKPGEEIPKMVLQTKLAQEAPDLMRTIFDLNLPSVTGRLRIPVIETVSKQLAENDSRTLLEEFLNECCVYDSGSSLLYKDVYDRFISWAPDAEVSEWTKKRFTKQLPVKFGTYRPRGRDVFIRNIKWSDQ